MEGGEEAGKVGGIVILETGTESGIGIESENGIENGIETGTEERTGKGISTAAKTVRLASAHRRLGRKKRASKC